MSIKPLSSHSAIQKSSLLFTQQLDLFNKECDPDGALKETVDKIHHHVACLTRKKTLFQVLSYVCVVLSLLGAFLITCPLGYLLMTHSQKYDEQINEIVKEKDFSAVKSEKISNFISGVYQDLLRGAVFTIQGKTFTVPDGKERVAQEVYKEMLTFLKAQADNHEEFFLLMAKLNQGIHTTSYEKLRNQGKEPIPVNYLPSLRKYSVNNGIIEASTEYFDMQAVPGLEGYIVSTAENIIKYKTYLNIKTKKVTLIENHRQINEKDRAELPLKNGDSEVFQVIRENKEDLIKSIESARGMAKREFRGLKAPQFALLPFNAEVTENDPKSSLLSFIEWPLDQHLLAQLEDPLNSVRFLYEAENP